MTILCYHAVDPQWQSSMSVHPDLFAEHAAWLADARRVVPLDDVVERGLPGSGQLALTFDDGFSCMYEHAMAILKAHRLPATVFLVSGTLVGGGRPVDWVDDPPSYPLRTLTRSQVLEMRQEGLRFGSHSYAHKVLTDLAPKECEQDLRQSREVLEDLLGESVPQLAYPRGRHDAQVRDAARRAGYTHAFSLPERREHTGPHAIPRVGVYGGNPLWVLRVKCLPGYLPLRTRAHPAVSRFRRRREPIGTH